MYIFVENYKKILNFSGVRRRKESGIVIFCQMWYDGFQNRKRGNAMRKKIWIIVGAVLAVAVGVTAALLLYCDHQWQAATCTQPSTCSECGKTQGAPLGHSWRGAACTVPETCSACGETRGEALGHSWQAATCTVPETCSVCGETRGEALDHDWQAATCTAPESCSRCDATQGEALGHTWQDATCTAPRTCSVCAATEGEVLPHSWQDATCLAPQTCSVCGLTQGELGDHSWNGVTCTAPRTCGICGLTDGSALGHVWVDATCTSAKRCTRCGGTSGSPLGHDFAESTDGVTKHCNRCGENVTIKYVAITFDDGPSGKITQNLLTGLEERGVKATFFLCGYRIKTYKTLPQTILDYGHEIGLHTNNHATLTKLDAAGIREELEGMMPMLPEGYKVTLMRPPGGAFNSRVKEVCKDMGLSVVMWSVDPKDWATSDVSTVTDRVVSGASDGSIILMHDLKSSSVNAALKAIEQLQVQGYEFVTVSQLAAIKGKTLEAGEVYYSVK